MGLPGILAFLGRNILAIFLVAKISAQHYRASPGASEISHEATLKTHRICKEVLDFVRASETLLSPILLERELTDDECDLISEYVACLSNSANPWNRPKLPKAS